MAGEHARIDIVAAARPVADDELDGLALVEIGHLVGARRRSGVQTTNVQPSGATRALAPSAASSWSGAHDDDDGEHDAAEDDHALTSSRRRDRGHPERSSAEGGAEGLSQPVDDQPPGRSRPLALRDRSGQ
jgi:hypothetical protein